MARTLLGFDFGRVRIGVAQGNTVTGTAQALTIIDSEPVELRWRRIAALVTEWEPALLVVGRPVPDERASNIRETARRCEQFADQLAQRTGLPVELLDESGSTVEAQALLRARHTGAAGRGAPRRAPKRRPAVIQGDDAEAAAVILRQYLSGSHGGEPARAIAAHDGPSAPPHASITG